MLHALSRHLYVLAVGGGAAVFAAGHALGWPLAPAIAAWSAAMLALGAGLERWLPFERAWMRGDGDTATDLWSAAVLVAAVDPLLKAVLPLVAAALLGRQAGAAWPLAALPLAVQVVAAVLWLELARYASHRLHHRVPALWRLHVLHHGAQRLYWLNGLRFHPLNHALNVAVSTLPLLLLGAPAEVMLGALALTQPVLMLQHANVRTANGWQNRVFSTNEVHRWHHAAEPAEAHTNYGSALVLWDQVFHTYQAATATSRPQRIGLFGHGDGDGDPSRAPYWRQVLACCRA
ncbi:MAG: sterol desaturase family protein [Proteobacteria bacterium]|nr:sterol desaturase family protein [Pseudomonadota bacterium]